jgi:hypothetical protein
MQSAPIFFCQILTKFGLSRQILIKGRSIKLHGNASSSSRADAWRTEGRAKRMDAFLDCANANDKCRGIFVALTPSTFEARNLSE